MKQIKICTFFFQTFELFFSALIEKKLSTFEHFFQTFLTYLHDLEEPLPEGEAPVYQGLLAELRPREVVVGVVGSVAVAQGFRSEEVDVVWRQASTSGRVELGLEHVSHSRPRHL